MIGAIVENLIGAFLSPRRSVRRLIDGGFGIDAALLLVLLGFAVRQIFVLITPGVLPEGTGISLSEYLMELMQSYVTFGFMTMLVYHVGRFFGGEGTLIGSALAHATMGAVLSWLQERPGARCAPVRLARGLHGLARGALSAD